MRSLIGTLLVTEMNQTSKSTVTLAAVALTLGIALALWGVYAGEHRNIVLIGSLAVVCIAAQIHFSASEIINREYLSRNILYIGLFVFAWAQFAQWIHESIGQIAYLGLCILITTALFVMMRRGLVHGQIKPAEAEQPK